MTLRELTKKIEEMSKIMGSELMDLPIYISDGYGLIPIYKDEHIEIIEGKLVLRNIEDEVDYQ